MKEHIRKSGDESRTPEKSPRASRQASFNDLLQASNNTGLPDNLKTGIENLSGYSLDDVRVHYHSDKPAQLQAYAYTQGTDIHVASGQEKHLPHEAWHVVQQKQGRVQPTRQLKSGVHINDNDGLEKEADVMGEESILQQECSSGKDLINRPVYSENIQLYDPKESQIGRFFQIYIDECWTVGELLSVNSSFCHFRTREGKYVTVSSGENIRPAFAEMSPVTTVDNQQGKVRLLLGEEDMSFTKALITKHPEVKERLISTVYGTKLPEVADKLKTKGVELRSGVDATQPLTEFEDKGVTDVYFHYPRAQQGFTKQLIIDSAQQAYNLLPVGGRFHLTIPKNKKRNEGKGVNQRNQTYGKDTINIIQNIGFELYAVRKDPQRRYGSYGYTHKKTGKETTIENLEGREYVFLKVDNTASVSDIDWSDYDEDSQTESDFDNEDFQTDSDYDDEDSPLDFYYYDNLRFTPTHPKVRDNGECFWDSLRMSGFSDDDLLNVANTMQIDIDTPIFLDQAIEVVNRLGYALQIIIFNYDDIGNIVSETYGERDVITIAFFTVGDGEGHYVPPY